MTEQIQAEEESPHQDEEVVHAPSRFDDWKRRAPAILAALLAMMIGVAIGTTFDDDEAEAPPEATETADGADAEATVWTCSMHPQVRADEPGQCPICGMDLIPVSSGGALEEGASPVRVQLSERAKKLAEVRTTPVRRLHDEAREVRLLGRIDHDETRLRTVTSWTGGRIDRLHVATTGEQVKAGQTIATIYSPEIYASHRDLIQARRQVQKLSGGMEFARSSAEATVESARQKLRLLGVSNNEIREMERTDEPWTQVRVRTRFGGTVIEKLVNEGTYVQAGTGIYRVADLSQLWVQLDAYESDLPRLRLGQTVKLTATALPDQVFTGKIAFIDPVVDRTRRTARVRVEVKNPDGKLKPGMFVEAVVEGRPAAGEPAPLVIPDTAPLFSGRRSVVYVAVEGTERPTYDAREVKLGPKAGGYYPVVAGLEAGERVVTHGAFAIDADLQIKGGASLMTRDGSEAADEMLETPAEFRAALAPVVASYLDIQAALADDDLPSAQTAARSMAAAAGDVDPGKHGASARAAETWTQIHRNVEQHAAHIVAVRDLTEAREGFEPLSAAMIKLLARFGNPTDDTLHLAFCPMVFGNRGAEWVQRGEAIDNSYFGAQMLTCGETRGAVPPGAPLIRQGEAAAAAAPAGGHQH